MITVPILLKAQKVAGIKFEHDKTWKEILAIANAENKFIFVDAFATWCGPCKQMDGEVYTDSLLGKVIDGKFVSIKIQIDKTRKDSENVRRLYKDAETFAKIYDVKVFPTFLFFSPNGKLLYKDVGYKTVKDFITLVDFAINPARQDFKEMLTAYNNGDRDYSTMAALSITVRNLLDNKEFAFKIAKDFKENYLDKLPDSQFLEKKNIQFINENGGPNLIKPNDKFFNICLHDPTLIDSMLNLQGIADYYIKTVVSREYIVKKIYQNNKSIVNHPNWKKIKASIHKEFPNMDVSELVLDQKIRFYREIENWNLYTFYKTKQLNESPIKSVGMNVFFGLNAPAWDIFLNCKDERSLRRALQWSELSLKLDSSEQQIQYLDTKANLLYKLGHVHAAIKTEEQAIELQESVLLKNGGEKGAGFIPDFVSTLEKMKKKIATWPNMKK